MNQRDQPKPGDEKPTRKPKKLKPYWAELGYTLGADGLFRRSYQKADGTIAHEVVLSAEKFHELRRTNLMRALLNREASPQG